MKTLIQSADNSATYEFSHDIGSKIVTYVSPEPDDDGNVVTPDFESMAERDHAEWLNWLTTTP